MHASMKGGMAFVALCTTPAAYTWSEPAALLLLYDCDPRYDHDSPESIPIPEFHERLDSFERMLVHDICEELGLDHKSVGQKPNRYITASRKPAPPKETEGGGEGGGGQATGVAAAAGSDEATTSAP